MFELTTMQFSIIILIMYHITTLADSLYLHRHWAHHHIKLNGKVVWFFEFWLWFLSGAQDPEIGRMHRFHHKTVDTPQDPHSPWVSGKIQILWKLPVGHTLMCINRTLGDPLKKEVNFSDEYPEEFKFSWVYPNLGMLLFLLLSFILFGFADGILFFLINLSLVWFHQQTFGFGLNHLIGYRNYDSDDKSRNVLPWGILFGGEDLHNNHHTHPEKINFAHKWFEFDVGYMYIKILNKLNLCEIKNK